MPVRRLLLLPLLAATLLSCADLPIIEVNRCGNGFIEPGEDCDYFNQTEQKGAPPKDTATCNVPGTTNECRWRCDTDAECQKSPVVESTDAASTGEVAATGGPVKAGSGWRCATDHVCRLPRGKGNFFEPARSVVAGSADQLFTGDFDGDRRKDVLAMDQAGFAIHYFSSESSETKSVSIVSAPVAPAIGKLTSGDADDFTLDVARGLGVMLGGLGETVDPTSYLSLDIQKRYGALRPTTCASSSSTRAWARGRSRSPASAIPCR